MLTFFRSFLISSVLLKSNSTINLNFVVNNSDTQTYQMHSLEDEFASAMLEKFVLYYQCIANTLSTGSLVREDVLSLMSGYEEDVHGLLMHTDFIFKDSFSKDFWNIVALKSDPVSSKNISSNISSFLETLNNLFSDVQSKKEKLLQV